jgi:hypothetical protein
MYPRPFAYNRISPFFTISINRPIRKGKEYMEKKITKRIAIGLITLSLLALLGLNIYEYQKFRYFPPAIEMESPEKITTKNSLVPVQIQTTENSTQNAQTAEDPQNGQNFLKKGIR